MASLPIFNVTLHRLPPNYSAGAVGVLADAVANNDGCSDVDKTCAPPVSTAVSHCSQAGLQGQHKAMKTTWGSATWFSGPISNPCTLRLLTGVTAPSGHPPCSNAAHNIQCNLILVSSKRMPNHGLDFKLQPGQVVLSPVQWARKPLRCLAVLRWGQCGA